MHQNKSESVFLKIAAFPERRLNNSFVTAGLAIFLAIWTVSPTVAGEKLFEQNTESQQENLRRRIAESEHVLLVCEFKQKWIPPEKNLPKGKLMFSARIIETYKGTLTVGKRISFFYYIEEPPKWLKSFESPLESNMKYLFIEKNSIEETDLEYVSEVGNHFGFEFSDKEFALLFRQMLSSPSKLKLSE